MERYIIILYIWRMLNSVDGGAKGKYISHIRRGRECQIPCINHHSPSPKACHSPSTRPAIFYTLSRYIFETCCKVEIFKRRLDTYNFVHHPRRTTGLELYSSARADSSSIIDKGKCLNAHWPSQEEVFGDADSPSRRGCAYNITGLQ